MKKVHTRFNILIGENVLVSPHRTKRPWLGQNEEINTEKRPQYDPECYLCPGNTRSGGQKNPDYKDTFSFDNDFSALLYDEDEKEVSNERNLLISRTQRGICKVICFSPKHNLTIANMLVEDIKKVIDLWQKEYIELGSKEHIKNVQIFENKGATMGCSNPHPHSQIWATEDLPDIVNKENLRQRNHFTNTGFIMLLDYLGIEMEKDERIIFQTNYFVALIPYWATWPYETMILPKYYFRSLEDMNDEVKADLALAMSKLTRRYNNLFKVDFPYSMGIHQAPTNDKENIHWLFHIHYYPPLLRSATVKKFMVGYELLAQAQRDITPEQSAAVLKALSEDIL